MAIPTLPNAVKQTVEVPIGDGWTVEPATQGGLLGLKINHVTSALKVTTSLLFDVDDLTVHTGEKISDGKASDYDFYLTGVKGLTVNLAGGVADDVDNGKIKIEVPIAINIPIPASPATSGIPLQREGRVLGCGRNGDHRRQLHNRREPASTSSTAPSA